MRPPHRRICRHILFARNKLYLALLSIILSPLFSPAPAIAQGHTCVAYCDGDPSPPVYVPSGPSPADIQRQQQQAAERRRVDAMNAANEAAIDAYHHGNYAAAVHWFQEALEFSPYSVTLKRNLADAETALARQRASTETLHVPQNLNGLAARQLKGTAAASEDAVNGDGLEVSAKAGAPFDRAVSSPSGISAPSNGTNSASDPIIPKGLTQAQQRAISDLERQRQDIRAHQAKLKSERAALEKSAPAGAKQVEIVQFKQDEQADQDKINYVNFKIKDEIGSIPSSSLRQ